MKRIGWILLLLIIGFGAWYFFIKDYNYRIRFNTPHPSGTVYTTLLKWNIADISEVDSVEVIENDAFNSLSHKVYIQDSVFRYNWKIKRLDDSQTQVTAFISDTENSFSQNLQAIYSKNDFVKRNVNIVELLMQGLFQHENAYNVRVESEDEKLKSQFCAYISLDSKTYTKGNTMMGNIGLIMSYLNEHAIPLTGDPFLQITSWDKETETIEFDFCFPIKSQNSFPEAPGINFKYASEINGLKAIFNGNYKLTDNAWYEMIDHAEAKGYELEGFPVEIYRNDPHSGGNELEWTAEIYWAVKNAPN